ncbi:hypothetical protein FRC09_010688, partial [Ceratobasidium sp. 395]
EQGTPLLSYFRVQGDLYRVDSSGRLWFCHNGDGQWYLVLRYNSIEEALSQLEELLQLQTNSAGSAPTPLTGQPRSPALVIAQTEIQELDQTTLTLANARPSYYYEDAQADIVSSQYASKYKTYPCIDTAPGYYFSGCYWLNLEPLSCIKSFAWPG